MQFQLHRLVPPLTADEQDRRRTLMAKVREFAKELAKAVRKCNGVLAADDKNDDESVTVRALYQDGEKSITFRLSNYYPAINASDAWAYWAKLVRCEELESKRPGFMTLTNTESMSYTLMPTEQQDDIDTSTQKMLEFFDGMAARVDLWA